ncbi:MAG TPA: hypothetical protein VHX36_02385 [Candidatus Acidoferrales bacterium]|jgi:hypothetical protein|nr:hypothetical protein [Candidatus Acidoferrales bacterium]
MSDPSITSYGEKSPGAPQELSAFSFLIGKWEGKGRTKIEDGKFAEYDVTWIGRYILDGTAIADELHGPAPDGSPYLGISLRQYDAGKGTWIIEYLNVSHSFLRRQVNKESGSVLLSGRNVTITSAAPGVVVREHYQVENEGFIYRLDVSDDDGKSWKEGQVEMTLRRAK